MTRTVPVAGDTPREPNPALADWILSADIYNADGTLRSAGGTAFCEGDRCSASAAGAYNRWTLHPGDRYWLFQWIEAGLFVAIAAVLLYAALVRVRRHIA